MSKVRKDKIRLMTDIAIYQKHNEESVFKVNAYFRYDYIAWNLLMAFLRFTFCAMIIFMIYVFFRPDVFFYNINLLGITALLKKLGLYYLAGLLLYLIISFIVYYLRYNKARKGTLLYASKLKRLAKKFHYADEER